MLQELFEDADAYVERPELRTEPEDLDDEQLRVRAPSETSIEGDRIQLGLVALRPARGRS